MSYLYLYIASNTNMLWNLRVDPKQCFFVIDGCGIIVVPTMKGQAKCAKAICVSFLQVPGLRYLGLGTQADTQQSRNPGYWQLGLGT